MSRVIVLTIDADGKASRYDEVRNAWRWYVSIWECIAKDHCLGPEAVRALDKAALRRLWDSIGSLPRRDSLILAATFDRCYVPAGLVGEFVEALMEYDQDHPGSDWFPCSFCELRSTRIVHAKGMHRAACDSHYAAAFGNVKPDMTPLPGRDVMSDMGDEQATAYWRERNGGQTSAAAVARVLVRWMDEQLVRAVRGEPLHVGVGFDSSISDAWYDPNLNDYRDTSDPEVICASDIIAPRPSYGTTGTVYPE